MENPKISVIIPVYNAERYLQQCLDSVLNQTLRDIEIICVNDGSTDSSHEILEEYAKRDNRITVILQENMNAGDARNTGLRVAKGEYLSFLDADDFFSPVMLEHAYQEAFKNQLDLIVFRTERYWEKEDKFQKIEWTVKKDLLPQRKIFSAYEIDRDFFSCILGYTWDKLFRRELVQQKQLSFQSQAVFNDSYFTYTALLEAKRIMVLDEVLVYQRKRASKDSITDRRSKFFDCGYKLLIQLKRYLIRTNRFVRYEKDFVNYAAHLLLIDLSNKHGNVKQEMLDRMRDSWLNELGLCGRNSNYFYDPEIYRKLKQTFPELFARKENFLSEIPVVYAADENYLRYVAVSMESILVASKRESFYRFIILVSQNISKESCNFIENIISHYSNCSVEFKRMGNEFDNAYIRISHITVATYYRLLLPNLLPEYDKCIYLDGDTIVQEDLNELYHIDVTSYYLAGARAYIYYRDMDYHKKRLDFAEHDTFEYVNAGVLVFNLHEMRQDNLVERFMKLLNFNFESQDQDILNYACRGKIKIIPFSYNMMTRYCTGKPTNFQKWVSVDELESGKRSPVVIHYADKKKPWNDIHSFYAKNWWRMVLTGWSWNLFKEDKAGLVISSLYGKTNFNTNINYQKKYEETKKEIQNIYKSKSYQIGRFITFIPRKIRGGIRCYKENGMQYTLNRAKAKFRHLVRR